MKAGIAKRAMPAFFINGRFLKYSYKEWVKFTHSIVK